VYAVGGIGSSSYGFLSSSGIESLVTAAMAYRQQEVDRLESQVDDLEVLQAILDDMDTKLSALDTVAEQLAGLSSSYTFGAAKSVTISDSDILSATASDSASTGQYNVQVTALAKAHSIRSKQYGQTSEALGLSGTFYIGGKASNMVSDTVTDASVTGFGTGTVEEGLTQLGSGDYYVEFRQNDSVWQFRVVDASGDAVAVKYADGTSGTTTGWQDFSDVAGTTFDTGRGLTITFDAEPTASKFIGDAGTPKVTYTAQGAAITVEETDSLADIKSEINAATYADGNGVQASIVDNYLVLTAAEAGAAYAIVGEDSVGTVLQTLELFDGSGAVMHELQAATDATLVINSTLTVTRSRNTGLTDVIDGVTLNLLQEGTTDLTVSTDLSAAQSKVSELLSKFNDVMSYLRSKTGLTETSSGSSSSNPTYSRGALAGDSMFTSLRYTLHNVVLARYDHGSLQDLGIGVNGNTLALEITDQDELTDALSNDMDTVRALLEEVGEALNDLLDPYVESDTDSVIAIRSASVDSQIENYNDRIDDLEERIDRQSDMLREQYYRLQQQLLMAYNRQQEWMVFGGSASAGISTLG